MARPLDDLAITQGIHSFHPFKAPGLDGLHPYFYQEYWPEISQSVVTFCKQVFSQGRIPDKINTTYLCLIPKHRHAAQVTHYRFISLCNIIYKIITKIIVNCIKPYLPNIISPTQASFLKGHRATNNAIMVQEIMNKFKNKTNSTPHILLKLDLEKVFDRLEWSFIRHILTYFNFPHSLISLIMSCISTSSISMLFNGMPTQYFLPSRGIRQGDPLSLYLLILCMEMLTRSIDHAVDYKQWSPITLFRSGPRIFHLRFTDDIILTSKLTTNSCHY